MKIGIVGNIRKPVVAPVIRQFVSLLEERGVSVVYADYLGEFLNLSEDEPLVGAAEMGDTCDFVVAFGGDGTMLSIANQIGRSSVPILGVNMGGLGFLAEVVREELEETIDCLLGGKYTIVERMVLEGKLHKKEGVETAFALNDFVVDKGMSPRLLFTEVRVDDVLLNTYRSDGVIVCTPTGSTAYSLSAGGPLVVPTLRAIIVTPICPHSLTVRPIVLSDLSKIRISISPNQAPAQLHYDGRGKTSLSYGEWVDIRRADYYVKWVSIGKRHFFEVLRTKLNWGIDPPVLATRQQHVKE